MKLIHCADLHLDSKIERIPPEKSKIRRNELVRTFEKLCEYAKENGVTAVIIAGDMFDAKRITSKTRGRVVSAIAAAPEVDFLYLSGNHDDESFINDEESDIKLPDNLKVFTEEWSGFSYGNVNVAGIVLTKSNAKYIYDGLALPENGVNIVILHGQIAGYRSEENAEIISIPRFKGKNVDYLALGHIHSYAEGKIDDRGIYVYSGCLDGRGFDETGEKGFVLIEVSEGKISREFIPFSSRILYEHEFDITDYEDWFVAERALIAELKEKYEQSSLIKVILKGEHRADFEPDAEGLTQRLNEIFFFAKVYDKSELKICAEDYAEDRSVRGEFVRAVLASELSEEKKTAVLMTGLNALKGEKL
mgnify:CR=1 FL=1